jgi:hypothetical protein
MTDDTDRQDEDLQKKITPQSSPEDIITDDSEVGDESNAIIGLCDELEGHVDDKDYVQALEQIDAIEEIVGRLRVYIQGKIE